MNRIFAVLDIIDRINKGVAAAAAYLILPLLIVAIYEVVSRYVFNAPTMWGAPMMSLIFVALVVPAGGHLLRQGAHVRMDVFYSRFSPKKQIVCDTVTFVVFLAFAGLLSWKTLDMAWVSVNINERSWGAFRAPIYPKKIVLALGCVLLLLQGLSQFVRNILALLGDRPLERS